MLLYAGQLTVADMASILAEAKVNYPALLPA